jgi:2-hydroxychromene-2-carboxylate isomerase
MKTVDFYFDFISPFAYLAATQLPKLAKQHNVNFALHAIDLFAAKRAAGNTGPSNREIPAKMKYLMADLQRWARRYDAPLVLPKGFDTARMNRGYLWAKTQDAHAADRYLHSAFTEVWTRGGDPADPALLHAAAEGAGLSAAALSSGVDTPVIVQAYEQENREAQARSVFGVPTFIVDDQMFWGNDRIMFLEEYLSSQS